MRFIALFICLSIVGISGITRAQQKDTIRVSNFGAHPYTYENCVTCLQEAISECKRSGARVLSFEKGRYDIWPEGAIRRKYFISNTSTEQECPSKVKTIGLLFEDMKDLTIEGNGATLMFHGKMTTIALERCKNLVFKDLHIDSERPAGSEMTFARVEDDEVEVVVHRDTRYEIVNGRMSLFGEGWRSNKNHCIEYSPVDSTFRYSQGWNVLAAAEAEGVAPNVVRFHVPEGFRPKVGNTLTIRDIIRDQVGWFIFESRDITLNRVQMHYMHGLGIVSQYTRNITMDKVKCMPREGSGRLLAASADMMHFSGCSGKVKIVGCYFAGAQDDPINVHGTNLRAVEKINTRTLNLRFMHGQSYGYNAYFEGDTVAFVKAYTMERFASAQVVAVKRLTDNTYYKTGMSAILIEGDAEGWYESGPVNDVLIQNNIFIGCAYSGGPENAVIALHPSNMVVDAERPVHRNVRIIGNTFRTFGNPVLYAKSTKDLIFKKNHVECTSSDDFRQKPLFILNGCKGVVIRENKLEEVCDKKMEFRQMKKKYIKVDF